MQRALEEEVTDNYDKTPKGENSRNGKNYGGRYGDRDNKRGYGDKKSYDRKPDDRRAGKAAQTEKADEPQGKNEKKPTAKIKLRLDVKDVVRGVEGKVADDEAESAEPVQTPEAENPLKIGHGDEAKILFEDNHVLVVVKPRNMPSQADSSGDPDFLSELKKYLIEKYNKPGDAYLGLLHRLDRPTGGVMVFAKTSKAAGRLSEQIRAGEFEKCYAAVTVGKPNKTGLVEHYLLKDEQNNIVTLAPSTLEGVKRAASEISIVDERGELSLVSLKLLTGRTHQARVQLKALGSPIVGDYKYAGDKLVKCKNLALWAYKLVFTHPISGEIMRFIAEPPQEFPWSEFDTDALVDIVRPVDRHYN